MSQQADLDQNLANIITKLLQKQPISEQQIADYINTKTPEISMQIGLMLHLYNQSVRGNPYFCNAGQLLHLKGLILGEFSKNLKLPDPIGYFVGFRYAQFEDYCRINNLDQLYRHTKGIYPRFNCQNYVPLQFLPLYSEIRDDQQRKYIFGNRQWQTTRFVIRSYFKQKIYNQIQWSHTNPQNNIVRLFYAILLGLDQQIDLYIDFIKQSEKDLSKKELQRLISSIKIWYRNYQDFIRQGIDMYLDKNVHNSQLFTFECGEQDGKDSRVFSIIQLIKDLVQSQNIGLSTNLIKKIAEDIARSSDFIEKSDLYMLLSLCQIISSNFDQDKQFFNNIYHEIDVPDQYFDRIFLTEREILRQYEDGKVTNLPKFEYTKEMMQKIYLYCLLNDYKIIFDKSLQKKIIDAINPSKIVDILSHCEALGETKGSEKNEQSDSQKILLILDSKQLNQRLQANQEDSISRYGRGFMENFKKFKQIWKKYHKLMKGPKNLLKSFQFKDISLLIEQSMRIQAQLVNNAQKGIQKQKRFLEDLQKKKEQILKQKSQKEVQQKIQQVSEEMQKAKQEIEQLEKDEEKRLRFQYPTDTSIASEKMLSVICDQLNSHVERSSCQKQTFIIFSQMLFRKKDETENQFIQLINNKLITKFVKNVRKESVYKKKYWAFLSQLVLLSPSTIDGLMGSSKSQL